MHRSIFSLAALSGTITLLVSLPAQAAPYFFFDDFEDGNPTDGSPATWLPTNFSGGTRTVADGDYVMTHSDVASSYAAETTENTDVSIRTQLRIITPNSSNPAGGAAIRGGPTGDAYIAGIFQDGLLEVWEYYSASNYSISRGYVWTGLRPAEEDVILEFTAVGRSVFLTAWNAGDTHPAEPQLGFYSDSFAVGSVAMGIGSEGLETSVAYRWFEAAEPAALPLGDANGDGAVNNLDIAPFSLALTDPVAYGQQFPGLFPGFWVDVNQDGALNNLDITPFAALLTGGAATAATVPEPAAMTLAAGGLMCLVALRRRVR